MTHHLPELRPLTWDSAHFGFPVFELTRADVAGHELVGLLCQAERQGAHLVYWPAAATAVSAAILRQFRGRLAARKVIYGRAVSSGGDLADEKDDGAFHIGEYDGPATAPALLSLAVAAGEYSRFFRDPGFARSRAEALYEIWMSRSVRGELADGVLVASPAHARQELCGVVTCVRTGNQGRIGLVAVRPDWRGCGLERRLLGAVDGWMERQGVRWVEVITQGDNKAACELYEYCGYRVTAVIPYYHFWMGGMPGSEPATDPAAAATHLPAGPGPARGLAAP